MLSGPRQPRYCDGIPCQSFQVRQLPAWCGSILSAASIRGSRDSRSGISMNEPGDTGCWPPATDCAPAPVSQSSSTSGRRFLLTGFKSRTPTSLETTPAYPSSSFFQVDQPYYLHNRSGCRVGLLPTERSRLCTAHWEMPVSPHTGQCPAGHNHTLLLVHSTPGRGVKLRRHGMASCDRHHSLCAPPKR
jgi:hypothetical protein